MAGIYIHIPFCKQACHYCNFHFSTSLRLKDELIDALTREIELRHTYLAGSHLDSIYFGGGTPSLLERSELEKIFSTLSKYYSWDSQTEITLEANPDDLSTAKIKDLKAGGINRLSIGIQSFMEKDLLFMNRAHNAQEAEWCIKAVQDAGFSNISTDLIYGSPSTSDRDWIRNIEKMITFDVPHISAYCLTVETGTALHHFVQSGKVQPVDEQKAEKQFNILMQNLRSNGYDHYEISNFGKPNHYAVHNTNYWMGIPYLGIGPGAHSFDGQSTRSWNIAHNPKYIAAIQNGELPNESETLTAKDRYNEHLLIRLRTKWGIDLKILKNDYPSYAVNLHTKIQPFLLNNDVIIKDEKIILTDQGKHFADRIAMELFAD